MEFSKDRFAQPGRSSPPSSCASVGSARARRFRHIRSRCPVRETHRLPNCSLSRAESRARPLATPLPSRSVLMCAVPAVLGHGVDPVGATRGNCTRITGLAPVSKPALRTSSPGKSGALPRRLAWSVLEWVKKSRGLSDGGAAAPPTSSGGAELLLRPDLRLTGMATVFMKPF